MSASKRSRLSFSPHCVQRQTDRGIKKDDIDQCIRKGNRICQAGGRVKCQHEGLCIVFIDRIILKEIITCYRRKDRKSKRQKDVTAPAMPTRNVKQQKVPKNEKNNKHKRRTLRDSKKKGTNCGKSKKFR